MPIRFFKNGHEYNIFKTLPPISDILASRPDEMVIVDEDSSNICLFNFRTPSAMQWFDSNDSPRKNTIVDAIIVQPCDSDEYHKNIGTFHRRYDLNVNTKTVISLLDIHNKSMRGLNNTNETDVHQYSDRQRIGVTLSLYLGKVGDRKMYEFISTMGIDTINISNLRETLKDWLESSQKIFLFTNSNNMLLFHNFIKYAEDRHLLSLGTKYHKSYFQPIKTFSNNLDVALIDQLFETKRDSDEYLDFALELLNVGQYSPNYNLHGIKINPGSEIVSYNLFGSSVTFDHNRHTHAALLLACIDSFGQLDQLRNQIERTKLSKC